MAKGFFFGTNKYGDYEIIEEIRFCRIVPVSCWM